MMATSATSIALMTVQTSGGDAWVHLMPKGTFTGVDGRGPWTLKDPAQVVEQSRQFTGKRQIVIDYEHQSIHTKENGKPAPAAGWIVGLQARPDGIWGKVEWTAAAAAKIEQREYRYLSPVFKYNRDDGTVMHLINAGLTNSPNLDQLTALASAEFTMDETETSTVVAAAAALLGLPASTAQATVLERLKQLSPVAAELSTLTATNLGWSANSATPDPAKYVPIGDFERAVADANKLRQGVSQNAAEHHVEAHIREGKLAPYLKGWAISLCTVNMPQYDAFVERVGPAFNIILAPQGRGTKPLGTGKTPNDQELAICQQMGLTPEEFAKARVASNLEQD